jgi:hypothetical protein
MRLSFPILMVCLGSALGAEPTTELIKSEYGAPNSYVGRLLEYPDFNIAFAGKKERVMSPLASATDYCFNILGTRGERLCAITFVNCGVPTYVLDFKVKGTIYVAEMFVSSIGQRVSDPVPVIKLRPDEIIVWSEASAKANNQRLLKYWKGKDG